MRFIYGILLFIAAVILFKFALVFYCSFGEMASVQILTDTENATIEQYERESRSRNSSLAEAQWISPNGEMRIEAEWQGSCSSMLRRILPTFEPIAPAQDYYLASQTRPKMKLITLAQADASSVGYTFTWSTDSKAIFLTGTCSLRNGLPCENIMDLVYLVDENKFYDLEAIRRLQSNDE